MTREVCLLHEKALLQCDCDCTCEKAQHVAMGIKGTHHTTECRWPVQVPRGQVRRRPPSAPIVDRYLAGESTYYQAKQEMDDL